MNPLYRNDAPGSAPPSLYAAELPPRQTRPALSGDQHFDVAVVGAGYTGLWAALTLARAGRQVCVLDAHHAGFGASGRNGGQVHAGFNQSQITLERRFGPEMARALWDIAEAARRQLLAFCDAYPEIGFRPGIAHGAYDRPELGHLRSEADHMAERYGHETEVLDQEAIRALVNTEAYACGTLDRHGGHLQPLALARCLAHAAEAAGATIFEGTEVTQIAGGNRPQLRTPQGHVSAGSIILAGNGYLPNLCSPVNARVMPINSFIAATEPLPDRWTEILAEDIAVADSRFVVNYYRFSADKRFLFGGRESYSIGYPSDIKTALIARMGSLFPQLRGVAIDHVWGGTLGITPPRLPHVARVGPNILSAAGFSGQDATGHP